MGANKTYCINSIGITCTCTSDGQVNIELQTLVGTRNILYISISKGEFENQVTSLLKVFEEYVINKSYDNLVLFANAASKALRVLTENAIDDQRRREWKKIFSSETIHDLNHVIYVFSQRNIAFPFGLLYMGTRGSISSLDAVGIANLFLGARSVIINAFSGQDEQLLNAGNIVSCEDDNRIIHCIRSTLAGVSDEKLVLDSSPSFKRLEAVTPSEFYRLWNESLPNIRIVHFSAEHGYNIDGKRFEIYLDNLSDPITTSDLYNNLDHADDPPLLFLNCCSTGFFKSDMLESFILAFSKYSWGIIATLVKIDSRTAANFAKDTYVSLFVGYRISEAIMSAKIKMIQLGDATGLCYEMWNINHKTRLKEVFHGQSR